MKRKAEQECDQGPAHKKAKGDGKVLLRLANGQPALTYYAAPSIFTTAEADACYEHMRTKYPWKHDTIMMHGKEVKVDRDVPSPRPSLSMRAFVPVLSATPGV